MAESFLFGLFRVKTSSFTLLFFSNPILRLIGTFEEPTVGPQPVKLRVFWLGRFCCEGGCCSAAGPRLRSARSEGNSYKKTLCLQVCISLMQTWGEHYTEPAEAAGIPFARGESRCKATELVLPSLADHGS
jgi:hypothetical protein